MGAQAVNEGATVPTSESLTVSQALEGIRELEKPGVTYQTKFMDQDGRFLRHFARVPNLEAWLVSVPVNADGSRNRGEQMIVCPINVLFEGDDAWRIARERELQAELDAAMAA